MVDHFVRAARKNRQRRCISDSTEKCLNYGQTLISTIALADQINKATEGEQNIGILLPPSVGAALANVAVTLLGKVSVNLNYTVSEELIDSAVGQCRLKSIITSRRFIGRMGNLNTLQGLVYLEDISEKINASSKIKAYLKARFLPRRLLTNAGKCKADNLMTIIFSSGSSGRPKGVMLSQRNILSNIQAILTVFDLKTDDNLCGVLPFFHSFGFTCSLWLALVSGASTSFAHDPLDGKVVGRIARQNQSTMLFAAPTFLQNYIRRAEPEDFKCLRIVITGAEKLNKFIADSFETKFGIRPLEGYGCTELSPVVSLSLTEEHSTGLYRVGSKEGAVGLVLPGIEIKIVSVENGKPVAAGQSGLLMVKGPNVMMGYLKKEKETAEVIKDSWYNTGDIAGIDHEGFLTIRGRLSRFSKIGGEMVPHSGIEQEYLRSLNTDEQVVAVTAVPEPKKGEELVVLYLEKAGGANKLHEIITKSKLPNIWKPRRDNYIKINSIPALGSGKLDVIKLRKIARTAKRSH